MELSSKNSLNNEKSLCLYCDKSFASIVEQENHVERDHKTILCKGKGSRKSERITKNISSAENSTFPGCFQCSKKTLRTDDLESLFQHLLTSHGEVYFGCKCKIRTQDKVSLANHKKTCKIGGGKISRCSEENVSDNRKVARKSLMISENGDSKCDSLSESEDNVGAVAVIPTKTALPTNAIHKKSDRSKLKNHSKNDSVNDRARKSKSSSSSTTSSSSKTGEDEYTIPLTRQKLKEPTIISRLGSTQNRNLSNKKSQKANKVAPPVTENRNITTASPITKALRTKTNKVVSANPHNNPEPVENVPKIELVSTEFDEDFYKNISQNIRLNMNSFIDGKSNRLQHRSVFDHIADQVTESSCVTEKPVSAQLHEKEIHEATDFELTTPFPALLTAEQYGFGDSNPNKNKRQITKNSWKWKWDLIKKYKYVNEGGKIVKKVKQITTGLKDLSQLDMWTQLSMRSRYEILNSTHTGLTSEFNDALSDNLSTRTIKTQNIEQLNNILDKCLTPEINIEQLEQTVIKLEPEEKEECAENFEMACGDEEDEVNGPELQEMFGLVKRNVSDAPKPLMSGEWARPRCYICVDCGSKFDLMKTLNDHKNSEHPYVVSAHYEIVGRENLEQKLYKNLFLPKKALQTSGFARSLSVNSDSKSNETNEASTSSDNSSKFFADQKEKECSKCLKMIKYSSDNDIYKHILDCIEDRVWLQAKRRSKYRRSRRKNRKTPRKSRVSIDQKKITSSPSTKDNTEGENSTPSISNPPTPSSNDSSMMIAPIAPNLLKVEPLINAKKPANGKLNDGMNIKNFFRVSKTLPSLQPKVIVQMLELPPNQNTSLRSSLRSSVAKKSLINENVSKNGSAPKNDNANDTVVAEVAKVEELTVETQNHEKIENLKESTPALESDTKAPLAPLIITTPEKGTGDFPLSSPSNSSLISPTNSSLISPTSNSNVPKKKKKLNDCIAMLTCKMQEKLGVNFFDGPGERPSSEKASSLSPLQINTSQQKKPVERKPSTSFQMESLLKESTFTLPVQEEVIDLSCKKKPLETELPKDDVLEVDKEELSVEIKTAKVEDPKVEPVLSIEVEPEETAKPILVKAKRQRKAKATAEKSETEVKISQEPLENKLDEEIKDLKEETQDVAEFHVAEEIEPESFKISIPKDKLPNLQDILNQYQIITVNNIKISESERRAFEEQKNRILQILNKTHNLNKKTSKRKAATKKVVKRKVPVKKSQRNAKKVEVAKIKAELPKKDEESNTEAVSESKVEAKLEEAIKTTNRIRCRRLSVVVDPIINLSAFQNKNRKIRLTNNSQQNGFLDLLAASEQFFSDSKALEVTKAAEKLVVESFDVETKTVCESKSEEELVSKEPENEPEKEEVPEVTPKLLSNVRAAKINAIKELSKRAPSPIADQTELDVISPLKEEVTEKASESVVEKPPAQAKKGRGKKQNVENIASPVVSLVRLEETTLSETKREEITPQVKAKARKLTTKKNASPLEEIKVEQSVKVAKNNKSKPDTRRKVTRNKPTASLLDLSFSSDTSNENDVPLAQLVAAPVKDTETVEKCLKVCEDVEQVSKLCENEPELEKVVVEESDKSVKEETAKQEPETIVNTEAEKSEPKEESETKFQPFHNKTSSMIDLNHKKSFEVFTINEDSFFNDDMDIDPSDKINDIVNNIINSSEFQIDSDTERSEIYSVHEQSFEKDQKMSSCTICKKTFRSGKGYEKHCTTSTHIMRVERRNRGMEKKKDRDVSKPDAPEVEKETAPSPSLDEAKVFRTKGALKTFDGVLYISANVPKEKSKALEEPKTALEPKEELTRDQRFLSENDDKLYYEFKMEKKPEDMTPKDKDQLFDSLFNSLEAKADEKSTSCKSLTPAATPQDSEMESSSTSWDLKHDDIEWEGDTTDNITFANAIKERYPKKFPVKINKLKDTAVSIPTKSLIMGKIFKKHRDSEKQKTPQAEAPNNKPGIKNSLDEIFDHLKNTAEIDDKVLTCPSPKTLLKTAGGTFSPNSSNSNDMLETASQSNNNNNIYKIKTVQPTPEREVKKARASSVFDIQALHDSMNEEGDDGIGKRKSRRRCAIKAKTCAETWSSDEYEELHDTEDIISIINEIEKRESIKKKKASKPEPFADEVKRPEISEGSVKNDKLIAVKPLDIPAEKRIAEVQEKKKCAQSAKEIKLEKSHIKKRRISTAKDGHKSDEEAFTATKKEFKPLNSAAMMKKRRMSCFVPSTTSFDEKPKPKPTTPKSVKELLRIEPETWKKFEKANENFDQKSKSTAVKKSDSEKSFKNQKKFTNLLKEFGEKKRKTQKHRKRPRNRVKNIAYDSDSDFELNLNKKPKASAVSESSSEEEEVEEKVDVIVTPKPSKSQTVTNNASRGGNANDMTMMREPKLLPNDLKHVVKATTNLKAAIPEDITDSSQSACNRTKRQSSEKLYYWSSSSSESDQEQGDTADVVNEDSVVPHQPEQHGWIVGASHKKLVTLLAHAKIKNKIN